MPAKPIDSSAALMTALRATARWVAAHRLAEHKLKADRDPRLKMLRATSPLLSWKGETRHLVLP